MKIDTQRWVDRRLGVPLLAVLSWLDRVLPKRRVASPRAILVILLSEMGSMVCAQPMFLRLRQQYPSARLYVLMLAKNRGVAELLDVLDGDSVVTIDDRSLGRFLTSVVAAVRTLRRNGVDVVIDCELFARASAILAWLSGAVVRIGFDRFNQEGLYRGSVITHPVPYNPYRHIASQFLALAGALDSTASPRSKTLDLPERPVLRRLEWPRAEIAEAGRRLTTDFPSLVGRRRVLLYPGAGILPIRAWPLEHFATVARALVGEGYAVAVIGLPDDIPLGARIVEAVGDPACVNLAGYTRSLRDLVLLFHHADLLISNDGGPGHFAALTPLAVVSLFGPETPDLYAPLCERGVALHRRLACSPCLTAYNHRNTACDGDNRCLKTIPVGEVLASARHLLEGRA